MILKRLVFVSISMALLSSIFSQSLQAQTAIHSHGSYKTGYDQFKTDVSLLSIAADEPIAPKGFPPLPDKLDLPIAQTGPVMMPVQRQEVEADRLHGGYRHEDAFSRYARPENNQPLRRPEIQPSYQRSTDVNNMQHLEAPHPIFIDQPHPQDLSLPDDESSTSGGRSQGSLNRAKQQIQNRIFRNPIPTIRGHLHI